MNSSQRTDEFGVPNLCDVTILGAPKSLDTSRARVKISLLVRFRLDRLQPRSVVRAAATNFHRTKKIVHKKNKQVAVSAQNGSRNCWEELTKIVKKVKELKTFFSVFGNFHSWKENFDICQNDEKRESEDRRQLRLQRGQSKPQHSIELSLKLKPIYTLNFQLGFYQLRKSE